MTKVDLLEILEDVPDEAEIKFVHQPNYPLQCGISEDTVYVVRTTSGSEYLLAQLPPGEEVEEHILYLAESGEYQENPYAPRVVTHELEWRET